MQKTVLSPSLLIPELFFPLMTNERNVLDIVNNIITFDFYRTIELGMLTQPPVIRRLRQLAEQHHLNIVQWMTFELLKDNLNLASLDPALRKKSVRRAKQLVHLAAETGTGKLSIVSGAKPADAHLQHEAKKCLADSLIELSQETKQFRMVLQIEPLDCFAHKKQLIGLTGDTVDWIQQFRNECPNLYIAWDSAHTALNREDMIESLQTAAPFISQLHLSNAVLNCDDPLYGDFHMPLGAPGFLTEETVIPILTAAQQLTIPSVFDELTVAVEVRTTETDNLWQHEKQCRHFLNAALTAL
ncbi:sugar phosphate isomerase/epimerase family protein [Necropsobacter rosorum]|uniref:sugar phosphate isomerase/epimerase family protein n=1 Tax=Necropsobacter rosorum TaxID=908285 RepID=UPI000509E3D8